MKRNHFIIILMLLILVVSCGSDPKTTNQTTKGLSHKDAFGAIGNVSKVYEASTSKSITLYSGAKFYTGQNIKFNGFDVVFEASLVEYNSLDPEVVSYVESLQYNNALMHQGYAGFDADSLDPEKTYVELATYTIIDTQEVLCHEVRVFYGDYMTIFASSGWYAKSVMFSPDLTIDTQTGINVYTGETVGYSMPFNNENGTNFNGYSSSLVMKEVAPMAEFSNLGDVNKAYAWFVGNELDLIHMFGGDETLAECYLVELNSLNPSFAEEFNENIGSGLHQREWKIVSEEGKYYVEVCYYLDGLASTRTVKWIDLRLRTEKMPNSEYEYFTAVIQRSTHI